LYETEEQPRIKSSKLPYGSEAIAYDEQFLDSTFDYELFMTTLPTSKKIREEFLLHEYDRRIKMQIAYQAANFELQDTLLENNRQFRALIYEQKRFEQRWPLTRRQSKPSDELQELNDECIAETAIEEREACFAELIKEARALIGVIQCGVRMNVTNS